MFIQGVISHLPANADRLGDYRRAQQAESVCSQIIRSKWPNKNRIKSEFMDYWKVRNKLTVVDELLMFNLRIVVPQSLQIETLGKIQYGHQGIHRCRQRLSSAVWWPGVSKQLEMFIRSCPECLKDTPPAVQPLVQTLLPSHPWERVAADLFVFKQTTYLIVADYYYRYVEVKKLASTTSTSVVTALHAIFSIH